MLLFFICLRFCIPAIFPVQTFNWVRMWLSLRFFFLKTFESIWKFLFRIFLFFSKIRCWCGLLCSDLWLCGGERTVIRPRRRSCVTTAASGSWRGASWSRCRSRGPASGTRDSKPTHPTAASASPSSCSLRSVQAQPQQNCHVHARTTGISAVVLAHILRVRCWYPTLVSVLFNPNIAVVWKNTL